jgi:RNA polymerase sigma-70 factor, ECF subfamily
VTSVRVQLEQLYRELAPALLAYFRRQPALAGVAEDLVQDTFARVLRRPERLRVSVSARAYVFGIARHVGLDLLRARRELVPWEDQAAPVEERDERLDTMRVAIAALPEPHRETLLLRLQQELSYEEIAEVLAVPVGTVRSRLHHAVLRLQEILNPTASPKPEPESK